MVAYCNFNLTIAFPVIYRDRFKNTKPRAGTGGVGMVGLTRLELVTSRMSSERSNQPGYRPANPSFQRPRLRNRKQWSVPFASARRYLAQGWTWRNPRNGFLTKNVHQIRGNSHMLEDSMITDRKTDDEAQIRVIRDGHYERQ